MLKDTDLLVFFVFCFFNLKSLILTCVPKHDPPSHLPPHNISLGHPHALLESSSYIIIQEEFIQATCVSVCVCMLSGFSHVWLFVNQWIVAYQAPLFMGFSRQEYWSGLPFSSPADLPDPGIELRSPTLQEDSLPLNHW